MPELQTLLQFGSVALPEILKRRLGLVQLADESTTKVELAACLHHRYNSSI